MISILQGGCKASTSTRRCDLERSHTNTIDRSSDMSCQPQALTGQITIAAAAQLAHQTDVDLALLANFQDESCMEFSGLAEKCRPSIFTILPFLGTPRILLTICRRVRDPSIEPVDTRSEPPGSTLI